MIGSHASGSFFEVLAVFTRLGLTSFGGPVAHLGYFHDELIERRKWLSEEEYADLVALCQFLPGPASSQVGIGLGIGRAGIAGGLAAWLGFTLPSALALIAFAFGVTTLGDVSGAGWLRGLKVVAVAVVAHAVWGMARKLAPDRLRGSIAIAAAVLVLVWSTGLGQVVVIGLGGLVGWLLLRGPTPVQQVEGRFRVSRRLGASLLVVFFASLVVLPVVREATGSFAVAVVDSFYRAGSLVFGGGHVVLPLLQVEVVPPGWIDNETFLAGYGAAQAVPGPLFTFSAYLGAVLNPAGTGAGPAGPSWTALGTAFLALLSMFAPSFLLLIGVLPFWDQLRTLAPVQAALRGVNAAVVGILLAALYDPVWTSAIVTSADVALAFGAYALLALWRWPAWSVVALSAVIGGAMQALG